MDLFEKQNPRPATELFYTTDFSFLIAVIASAQATDVSVNKVTTQNITAIDSPQKVWSLGEDGVRDIFKSINAYKNKSKYIVQTAAILIEQYNAEVPLSFEELIKLPGVGRKTANVVLNTLTNASRIAVDTHVLRVCSRLGLSQTAKQKSDEDCVKQAEMKMDLFPNSSKSVFEYVDPVLECSRTSKYAPLLCSVSPSQNSDFEGFERGPMNPENCEHALYAVVPKRYWSRASNWLILHGRYVCKARKPQCESCVLRELCASYIGSLSKPSKSEF
jgi:endonuclease III